MRFGTIMIQGLITSGSPREQREPVTFIGAYMALEMSAWAHRGTWQFRMNNGKLYRLLRKGDE
jgi:hypothetical protein